LGCRCLLGPGLPSSSPIFLLGRPSKAHLPATIFFSSVTWTSIYWLLFQSCFCSNNKPDMKLYACYKTNFRDYIFRRCKS
jgi:hypothetical protein